MEEMREFPPEPHLGFGSYLFQIAADSRLGFDQSVNHALGGFSVKMPEKRFVHQPRPVLYEKKPWM